MPKRPCAPPRPSRKPVITSSNTSSAPASVQRSRRPLEEAVGRRRPGPCWRRPAPRAPPRGRRRARRTPRRARRRRCRAPRSCRRRCPAVTPAEPGRPSVATPLPGRDEQRVDVAVVAAANFTILARPVAPRASRTAVIAASVPDDTSRTFSTDGTRVGDRLGELDLARGRRAERRAVGRGALHRLDDRRVRVAEDRRAPRLHVVEVAACRRCRRGTRPRPRATKNGSPPTDAERPHRRVRPRPGCGPARARTASLTRSRAHARRSATSRAK